MKRRLSARVRTLPCLLLLAGCVAAPPDPALLDKQATLLNGEALFGEVVDTADIEDVDILASTPEMDAFLESQVGHIRIPSVKFRRLLKGLADEGYFHSTYSAETTHTAAETFHRKRGNCLSYTNMFVALARKAGLNARYQIVEVPPSWDADAEYLIRYTHINVVLRGFSYDAQYGQEFSVDFNDVLPDPDYPRYEISDQEATALFYANRSIQYLRSDQRRRAFAHLKKALSLDPDNADLWINLGAMYATGGAYDEARQAYEVALFYEPRNRGAISGLARAHYLLGNSELAAKYEDQVRRYRARNPYFHYAIAQAEYESGRYESALQAINVALDLKYRNGRFHFLKGLTEYKLGDEEAAKKSFQRAARYGNYRDLKRRYLADARPVAVTVDPGQ